MLDLIIWEAFALPLAYSLFCRALHTHKGNTKRDVRWVFTFMGVVALVCVFAPFFGYDPDALTMMLLAAIAMVQVVTAHHWYAGVPARFQKDAS